MTTPRPQPSGSPDASRATAGFFESLYAGATRDDRAIPWQEGAARPLVERWLADLDATAHQRAVVVAAGLGDDAAALARRGLDVTAFDAAPSAVAWAQERHPDVPVRWHVADLFDLPPSWHRSFDLVVEVFTLQSIPPRDQTPAARAVAGLVAPGGSLKVIALVRPPEVEPDGPPWPLHPDTLDALTEAGLRTLRRVDHPVPDRRYVCTSLDAVRDPHDDPTLEDDEPTPRP